MPRHLIRAIQPPHLAIQQISIHSHPYPENRRERVSNLISGTGLDYSGYARNRNSYVRKMNGLVYGEDPRQGFFQDGTFHHPELARAILQGQTRGRVVIDVNA